MNEKPILNVFLRNVFGLGKAGPESPQNKPAAATRRSEAYQNRKKGRKQHEEHVQDLQKMIAFIQSRGEATPGEMASELGMSRSTLTYKLNLLLKHNPGVPNYKKYFHSHLWNWLLGQKRVERLGAGQSIRYRIVEVPSKEKEGTK
jgi:AraC-like DNA-binding protein